MGHYGITGDLTIKPLKELSGGDLTKVRFSRLTMETSNTGWLVNGYTEFRNDTNQDVNGTVNYIGGNNTLTPSLLFCLHHVKNIATAGDMGSVTIQLLAVTQLDDLNKQIERLAITINLQRVLYTTADYEGAMTAGRKYELFTSTATNISSASSVTIASSPQPKEFKLTSSKLS